MYWRFVLLQLSQVALYCVDKGVLELRLNIKQICIRLNESVTFL